MQRSRRHQAPDLSNLKPTQSNLEPKSRSRSDKMAPPAPRKLQKTTINAKSIRSLTFTQANGKTKTYFAGGYEFESMIIEFDEAEIAPVEENAHQSEEGSDIAMDEENGADSDLDSTTDVSVRNPTPETADDDNESPSEQDQKLFACVHPGCEKSFSTKCILRDHVKGKHQDAYNCRFCRLTFARYFVLQRHNERFHGVYKEFRCPGRTKCAPFATREERDKHWADVHKKKEKKKRE